MATQQQRIRVKEVVLLGHRSPPITALLEWLIAEDPEFGRPIIVTSSDDAIERATGVEVALLHIGLPGRVNTLQAVGAMKHAHPELAVLVLGADVPYLRSAINDAGADGFVDEHAAGDQVLHALHRALRPH
jgi:DNA-binding NarL/FixJ family response regulator